MNTFLNPDDVLNQIDLQKNMVAAEFGCGSGGFSIPLAKKLEDGLVYSVDLQEAPLSALKSRCAIERITNIRVIKSDLEQSRGSTIPDLSLDLVLAPNMLFQVSDKNAVITEAKRILKREGKLVVVDWLPNAKNIPVEGRILPEAVKEIARNIGFKLEKEFQAGQYHYGLVFSKP